MCRYYCRLSSRQVTKKEKMYTDKQLQYGGSRSNSATVRVPSTPWGQAIKQAFVVKVMSQGFPQPHVIVLSAR